MVWPRSQTPGWLPGSQKAKKLGEEGWRMTVHCLAPDLTCPRAPITVLELAAPRGPWAHPCLFPDLSPPRQACKTWLPLACVLPGHVGRLPRAWLHLWLSPALLLLAQPQASPARPQIPGKLGPQLATQCLFGLFPPFPGAQVSRSSEALGLETLAGG